MPRVSRAETELNREAIERASSRLIREQGLGVSVANLMAAAGLTHGGFYGHFESKDELNSIACAKAFAEAVERWEKRVAGAENAEAARSAIVEAYLSQRSRGVPGASCPLAALAADVAREEPGKPVRAVFNDGLEQLLEILTTLQPQASKDPAASRAEALVQLSAMVGALVLARATKGREVSNEIMAATREHLLSR